jgi:hypothetical protein
MLCFDEQVFPFSTLRPNASARLRSEIALLHPSLINPNTSFGNAMLLDQGSIPPVNTDVVPRPDDVFVGAGENTGENGAQNHALQESVWRQFM